MNFMQISRIGRGITALALMACAPAAFAQQYTISTLAGGAPPPTPAAATGTAIGRTSRVAADAAGNVYFSASNAVFKIGATGTLALVAGNSRAGFSGDGGPAAAAQLNDPQGIAIDKAGNIYIADSGNNRVRVVSPQGVISTFAGNGRVSPAGGENTFNDGGPATDAVLHRPMAVALDSSGNVFIADTSDNVIRQVDTTGTITTVAGDGYPGYISEEKAATGSELDRPADVAVDSAGLIYIVDSGNSLVRKIGTDGILRTIAGSGAGAFSGDGADALKAGLYAPAGIVVDSSGSVFILQNGDGRIRKVDSKGIITTLAGNGTSGFAGDGGQGPAAQFNFPTGIAGDSSGNLYVADSLNQRIRKINSSGSVSTVAGNGGFSYSGDGGAAGAAQLYAPLAVAVDATGNIYVADTGNNVVRKIGVNGAIAAFAGTGAAGNGGDGGAAISAQLNAPSGVAADAAGNVYISDTGNARVRKVASNGTITAVAGSGTPGFGGDGGTATSAQLSLPMGLAVDAAGNLFIADFTNNRVRKVSAGGTITTVAGNGSSGYSGDSGPAVNARLSTPQGVAVDAAGNLYIADTGNHVIRQVGPSGLIGTTVGVAGVPGSSGDSGPATQVQIGNPAGVAVDAAGNLYIADSSGRVRKVVPAGVAVTIAGTGARGYSGDGGFAPGAALSAPSAVAVSSNGTVYVADTGNNAVRALAPSASGLTLGAVANGASNLAGAVAPGEVVVLYGSGLGPGTLAQAVAGVGGGIPTSLAGTTVFFGGIAAPLIYTSATQVAAIVPFNIQGSSVPVTVVYQGQAANTLSVPLAATAPALFTIAGTGTGQALAIHVTGNSLNGAANPAKAGSYITLYATGAGQTTPPGVDGTPGAVPLPLPVAKVTATIGGKPATVQYAGGAEGIVAGVIQVNVQIPAGLPAGAAAVVLKAGDAASPEGVTVVLAGN